MAASGFAYSHLFTKDLPPAAPRWTGFPKYNFIGGHNDPEHVPAAALAAAAAAVLRRDGADLALYNPHGPQGFRGIRDFVVGKVAGRGIHCSPDEVLITSGSGQGLDLVNRVLLERGDTVILEEFTYGGALTKLQRIGVNVVGAPLDDDGLRIDALGQILDDLGRKGTVPKYIYTIPTVQNPTGSILPAERRQALLGLAKRHGVAIFEDECYADLTWSDGAPAAIYSMDPTQVVHVGSFSKTLSPALRLGYVVADWEVMSRLVGCKRETDSGTGALEQMVVRVFLAELYRACRRTDRCAERKARHDGRCARTRVRHHGRKDVAAKGRHLFVDQIARSDRRDPAGRTRGQRGAGLQSRPRMVVQPGRDQISHAPLLRPTVEANDPRGRGDPGACLLRANRHPRAKRQHQSRASRRLSGRRLRFTSQYTPPAFCSPRRSRKRQRRRGRNKTPTDWQQPA